MQQDKESFHFPPPHIVQKNLDAVFETMCSIINVLF